MPFADNGRHLSGPMETDPEFPLLSVRLVCLRLWSCLGTSGHGTDGRRYAVAFAVAAGVGAGQAGAFYLSGNGDGLVARQRPDECRSALLRAARDLLLDMPGLDGSFRGEFRGTLHPCSSWLRRRYWLACALGVCGGPLAYYTGQRLGAMRLGNPLAISLMVIAIEWSLVTPALVYLSEIGPLDGLADATRTKAG